jgi:hypothetical protein
MLHNVAQHRRFIGNILAAREKLARRAGRGGAVAVRGGRGRRAQLTGNRIPKGQRLYYRGAAERESSRFFVSTIVYYYLSVGGGG